MHSYACVLALLLSALALPAQPRQQKLDSAAATQAALNAQRTFERVRLAHMPHGPSAARSGGCDEIIGRFCYSFGDRSAIPVDIPLEDDEVKRARNKLIAELDALVDTSDPTDWLLGTLVRYQVEANEGEAALHGLSTCGAAWWCAALRGFVAHRMDRHAEAEAAFDDARAKMDRDTRCAWDDITPLLARDDRKAYRALPCEERLVITRSAWWLAQPLYSRHGNDRRSEHDARRVLQRLSESGVNPTWLKWGNDMSELLARFGWPQYWRRYWGSLVDAPLPNPHVSEYHAEPSYHFLPVFTAMRDPWHSSEYAWNLLPNDSREEYSPSALIFGALDQQSARFLRGDSLLLVTRVNIERDSLLRKTDVGAAVVLTAAPGDSPTAKLERKTAGEFLVETRTRNANWIASVEVKSDSNRAARARFGAPAIVRDASGHAISDMMFYDAGTENPEHFAAAVAAMRASVSIAKTAQVGIYWEMYGLSRADQVSVELSAEPEDRGFLRRIGEALRLVGKEQVARVQWPETANENAAVISRSIALSHASLAPGWYNLRLSVTVNSAAPLIATRRVEILR